MSQLFFPDPLLMRGVLIWKLVFYFNHPKEFKAACVNSRSKAAKRHRHFHSGPKDFIVLWFCEPHLPLLLHPEVTVQQLRLEVRLLLGEELQALSQCLLRHISWWHKEKTRVLRLWWVNKTVCSCDIKGQERPTRCEHAALCSANGTHRAKACHCWSLFAWVLWSHILLQPSVMSQGLQDILESGRPPYHLYINSYTYF